VNKAWGERGSLEKHRAYITEVTNDPAVLPLIMSWNGEPMGYAEITYLKVGISDFLEDTLKW
jgi:hypothetical protein